jgi:hypothetical protein
MGLLQPLDVPSIVWDNVAMDFMEGFPHINDKSVILTVADRFSKYGHFIPFEHPYTATTVAKAFFGTIVRLHGSPIPSSPAGTPCSPASSGASYSGWQA